MYMYEKSHVCMYEKSHVCMYEKSHVCMYEKSHVCMYEKSHVCMYEKSHVCMYEKSHVCMYEKSHVCMYEKSHVCMYEKSHVCMYEKSHVCMYEKSHVFRGFEQSPSIHHPAIGLITVMHYFLFIRYSCNRYKQQARARELLQREEDVLKNELEVSKLMLSHYQDRYKNHLISYSVQPTSDYVCFVVPARLHAMDDSHIALRS